MKSSINFAAAGSLACAINPAENTVYNCMGAGKGHTLQHLQREGLFPLNAFVRVDPDVLREVHAHASRTP
jgi:hypothetical protein